MILNMNLNNNTVISDLHIPRWNELPSVNLYLEQVVDLVDSTLAPYIFFNSNNKKEENVVLSKTMINNYVKHNLIEAPIKKKYGKNQIAKLFAICVLKQVYSMNDIKNLIEIATKNSNIETAYNSFCQQFQKALKCTFEKKDFIDSNSALDYNKYLLKSVLLSCSYKIYTQNILKGN